LGTHGREREAGHDDHIWLYLRERGWKVDGILELATYEKGKKKGGRRICKKNTREKARGRKTNVVIAGSFQRGVSLDMG